MNIPKRISFNYDGKYSFEFVIKVRSLIISLRDVLNRLQKLKARLVLLLSKFPIS